MLAAAPLGWAGLVQWAFRTLTGGDMMPGCQRRLGVTKHLLGSIMLR